MKTRYFLLALLLASPAFAQSNPNNTNIPITQMQNGNPTQATDAVHIARCNHKGCDYQVRMGGNSSPGQIIWNNGGVVDGLSIGNGLNVTTSGGLPTLVASGGGGGGSGITSQQIVLAGASATAVCGEFVGFNSVSGGFKTLTIPASTGSLCIIVTADLFGDAATNPITPVPVSGSIFGSPQCYTSHCSITLLDTSAGWVPI
jgi:hypothetical protein